MKAEEKNYKYWELHKQIWNDKFDSLNLNVCRKIMDNPMGPECQRLTRLVERKVSKIMKGQKKKKTLAQTT
tara:strand:- start:1575 stop:1787 length:213 start_codon:yes stop_codon:yes gene_type:complete